MDRRTNERTYERTNESPPVFYRTSSPSGPLPKSLQTNKAGYTATPVAWGSARARFQVSAAFGQEQLNQKPHKHQNSKSGTDRRRDGQTKQGVESRSMQLKRGRLLTNLLTNMGNTVCPHLEFTETSHMGPHVASLEACLLLKQCAHNQHHLDAKGTKSKIFNPINGNEERHC